MPWFIDGPHEIVLRRVAEAVIAVQIETKKIHHLCVSHQQFTEAKRQNVGTLLIEQYLASGAIASVNCNPPGNCVGGAAGLKRNVSLEATKEFMKSCPPVIVTDNREAADYVLRINRGSSTLYGQNGDVAYISPAKVRVSNLVKDVCNYVKAH